MTRMNSARSRASAVVVGTLLITTAFGLATASTAEAVTSTTVAGPVGQHSEATCPEGTHLIGGGYAVKGFVPIERGPIIFMNGPSPDTPNTWAASSPDEIQALALCETNS
ncbi:hypothetical protein GCM10010507_43130 [Streptomyces cinnamoneus]|uniref:Secreted protein n=1 Tax=Streptomyces cinnamoneus TaxID=53446 RepID=A0A918TTM8_STRCJ|nr:hypothetical protein GCM10010507_43130 [Streptomyces cinnamoneus]